MYSRVRFSSYVYSHPLIKFYVELSLTPVQTTNCIKSLTDNLNISPEDICKWNKHYTNSKTNKSIKNARIRLELAHEIIRSFVYRVTGINNDFSRKYTMYMAFV